MPTGEKHLFLLDNSLFHAVFRNGEQIYCENILLHMI